MTGPGAGFFGKLASHGDFVSRRLPPAFVAAWDGWLQACMAASREALGQEWLDAYLGAPVWRFALAPAVCGADVWAGVLMPSVDRVGRHFPLMLAAASAGPLPLAEWMDEGAWYERLVELALSTLDVGFCFERFDESLCKLAPLPTSCTLPRGHGVPTLPGMPDTHGWRWEIAAPGAAGAAAGQVAQAALSGHSVWWSDGPDVATVLLFRGLPPPQAFAAMLGRCDPLPG